MHAEEEEGVHFHSCLYSMILYRATRVGPHALFCGDSETGDESSALGVGVGVEKRCKTDGGRYTCQDNFGFPSRIPSFNGHFRMGRMLAESTNTWHASVRRPRPWRHNTIELKSTELRSSRSLYYRTKPLSRTYLYVFVCDVTRFTHLVMSHCIRHTVPLPVGTITRGQPIHTHRKTD